MQVLACIDGACERPLLLSRRHGPSIAGSTEFCGARRAMRRQNKSAHRKRTLYDGCDLFCWGSVHAFAGPVPSQAKAKRGENLRPVNVRFSVRILRGLPFLTWCGGKVCISLVCLVCAVDQQI
jgi:hypothetical protein